MVKLTLNYMGKNTTLLVPEEKPIRDILKEDAKCPDCSWVFLDGVGINPDEYDRNILQMGYTPESEPVLAVVERAPWEGGKDNGDSPEAAPAPRVRILGCACIIRSDFTPEELRDFKRYLPEALTMYGDNNEPVFAIALVEDSSGSLTEYGAVFSRKTNSDGKALMTILIDPDCDDAKETIRQHLGSSLLRLMEMEKQLKSKVAEMQRRKEALDKCIVDEGAQQKTSRIADDELPF